MQTSPGSHMTATFADLSGVGAQAGLAVGRRRAAVGTAQRQARYPPRPGAELAERRPRSGQLGVERSGQHVDDLLQLSGRDNERRGKL
jgi:hypothetical protein